MGLLAGGRDADALAHVRVWNALGGICWATAVGLLAYFLGTAASNAIEAFGIYGLVAVVIAAGGVFVAHRRHRRRMRETIKR